MNKDAQTGELMLVPVVLVVMVIIAVGLLIGVSLVFGSEYDFREVDSMALNQRLRECLLENSTDNIIADAFTTCGIKKEVIEKNNMFFKICQNMSLEECSTSEKKIVQSGSNFVACFLTGTKENSRYPRCTLRELGVKDEYYSIITGSNQILRRVKQ